MNINLLKQVKPLFDPQYRFYVLFGGRSSGKSWAVARILIILSLQSKIRILCIREFMSSISSSVHKLLCDQIKEVGLENQFNTTNNRIVSSTGSEFIFSGIKNDPSKIKSTEGVDYCFIEEAETISEQSWEILIPTIRKPNSKFFICFNTKNKTDPTYQRFIVNPPPRTWSQKINYLDNPFCPEVMIEEANYCKETDPDKYDNIWLGNPLNISDSIIFKNKFEIKEFSTPDNVQIKVGLDFGYSNDPFVIMSCFILDECLYIDHAYAKKELDFNEYSTILDKIPNIKRLKIFADCSLPGNIALIKKQGYFIEGAKKWPNSIQDGITYLKSFRKIIIHPRAEIAVKEAKSYSWRINKQTDEILAIPEDANCDFWDATRYALNKEILASGTSLSVWSQLGK